MNFCIAVIFSEPKVVKKYRLWLKKVFFFEPQMGKKRRLWLEILGRKKVEPSQNVRIYSAPISLCKPIFINLSTLPGICSKPISAKYKMFCQSRMPNKELRVSSHKTKRKIPIGQLISGPGRTSAQVAGILGFDAFHSNSKPYSWPSFCKKNVTPWPKSTFPSKAVIFLKVNPTLCRFFKMPFIYQTNTTTPQ